MTDRELKPCPFCGGEAEFSRDGEYHVLRCTSCRAEHADEIKRKAVERWNTRAALRPEAQGVKVKPLEWECTDFSAGDGVEGENDCAWAARPHLSDQHWPYEIFWHGGNHFEVLSPFMGHFDCGSFDEAKKAAQADYERRILSALDRPEAQDGVADAYEEAAEWAHREAETCFAQGDVPGRIAYSRLAARLDGLALRALSQGGK